MDLLKSLLNQQNISEATAAPKVLTPMDYEAMAKKHTAEGQRGTRTGMV